jgi:hypothetical protein
VIANEILIRNASSSVLPFDLGVCWSRSDSTTLSLCSCVCISVGHCLVSIHTSTCPRPRPLRASTLRVGGCISCSVVCVHVVWCVWCVQVCRVCLVCTGCAGWGVDRVCWVHTPDPGWYPVGKGAGTPLEDPSGRVSGTLSGGCPEGVWRCWFGSLFRRVSGVPPADGTPPLRTDRLCILLIQPHPGMGVRAYPGGIPPTLPIPGDRLQTAPQAYS